MFGSIDLFLCACVHVLVIVLVLGSLQAAGACIIKLEYNVVMSGLILELWSLGEH